jgi:hypothetical protein
LWPNLRYCSLHFNKENCGHHEEFIVDFSHRRDLYSTPPEYEARMRPVDCDRGFVDFCPEIVMIWEGHEGGCSCCLLRNAPYSLACRNLGKCFVRGWNSYASRMEFA